MIPEASDGMPSIGYPARMAAQDNPEDDDAALFRSAIGPVKRLPEAHTPPAKAKPRARPRMAERDEAEALVQLRGSAFQSQLEDFDLLQAGDVLSYRRDHVPPRLLQRLKRGQFSVQDELDLHGATVQQAATLLREFLAEAHAHDYGCVRIVHGKGLQSEDGLPALKNATDRMLRQRADVLAFHSAPTTQGGTGAVLVLLAGRR